MPATLSPSDAVLLAEGRRRLARVHEGLAALEREARKAARQRLVEAWRALEAAEAGEGPVEGTLGLLEALEVYAPPDAAPPFRPTFRPLEVRLLRRAVSDALVEATFDRYTHHVDVGAFVDWLFTRLPPLAVKAFEAEHQDATEEVERESYELVWKRPRRTT
jgi:hypothetical protein